MTSCRERRAPHMDKALRADSQYNLKSYTVVRLMPAQTGGCPRTYATTPKPVHLLPLGRHPYPRTYRDLSWIRRWRGSS